MKIEKDVEGRRKLQGNIILECQKRTFEEKKEEKKKKRNMIKIKGNSNSSFTA